MEITVKLSKQYKLSENFTLYELLHSDTAIAKNIIHLQLGITEKEILNLKRLCENVLQPLRDHVKVPVRINSGYRSLPLNTLINGSKRSDHLQANAADIWCSKMPEAWEFLKTLEFRQLIKYGDFRFIHISHVHTDNKKQILELK